MRVSATVNTVDSNGKANKDSGTSTMHSKNFNMDIHIK